MLSLLTASVRGRIITFSIIAAIPIIAFSGIDAVRSYDAAAEVARERTILLREAGAARFGAVIEGAEQVLLALSHSLILGRTDLEACEGFLAAVVADNGVRYSGIGVADRAGRLVCSSVGPQSRGADISIASWFCRAVERGAFVVGAFETAPVTRLTNIGVGLPMRMPDGSERYLGIGIRTEFLVQQNRSANSAGSAMWLIDRTGRPLPITSDTPAEWLPNAADQNRLLARPRLELTANSQAGDAFLYAAAALEQDLHLLVGLHRSAWQPEAIQAFWRRAFDLTALLIACMGAVMLGLHLSVVRPLRLMTGRIRGWTEQSGPFAVTSDLVGAPVEVLSVARAFAESTTTLLDREQKLSRAVAEREGLLSEIHHRVKNSLQMVASLLNLQQARIASADARRAFQEAADRVLTLSLLHRHLYEQDAAHQLRLPAFLEELCRHLFQSYDEPPNRRIKLEILAADITLPHDLALPLALIITEAVTNALKFAFPDDRHGTITLRFLELVRRYELAVGDDGVGGAQLDTGGALAATDEGLGWRLVKAFVQQLDGDLKVVSKAGEGTLLTVSIPIVEAPSPG